MNNEHSNTFGGSSAQERPIGDIFREANNLTAEQVLEIVSHQKAHGVRFGEAAVQLGYVRREQVLWALSQQFDYPYAASRQSQISPELVVAHRPFGENAEFFRDIRSQLISALFALPDSPKAIAVTSPDVGDGKSYFAANLAASFSQLGGRTLLIDGDLRSPRQQKIFSISDAPGGLSSILSGRAEGNVITPVEDLPSLFVLPVGVVPPNPLELVQRPAFGLLLAELRTKFDYIIVDTPAASRGSDCRVIASCVGASLGIVRAGVTAAADIKVLSEKLAKSSRFMGVVLNKY